MGDQTQAYDIFQTPLSSGYPLPLRSIAELRAFYGICFVMLPYFIHENIYISNHTITLSSFYRLYIDGIAQSTSYLI
jgi:hypothetical protein